jgi:hypothetical protein
MTMQTRLPDYLFLPVVFTCLVLGSVEPAEAGDTWQERMLLDPPPSQLELESRGRVMIYDGQKDSRISQAMDTQFDRIQSMMFVRTVVSDDEGEIQRDEETGTVVVDDDGC